jgi:hypothetical protein
MTNDGYLLLHLPMQFVGIHLQHEWRLHWVHENDLVDCCDLAAMKLGNRRNSLFRNGLINNRLRRRDGQG